MLFLYSVMMSMGSFLQHTYPPDIEDARLVQILILPMLLILSGDVETNPGPQKTGRHSNVIIQDIRKLLINEKFDHHKFELTELHRLHVDGWICF